MNAISFSLYGNSPKYCLGAIRNIPLAREFYPGWKCVFYCDETVPELVMGEILDRGGQLRSPHPGVPRMLWRAMINDDPEVERYIVRDTDSRLNAREAASVNAWVKSGKMFLSQRDHPAHAREINGGLWGAVRGLIPSMENLIHDFEPGDDYSDDQTFLCRVVWPLVRHECLQHDSVSRHLFPGSLPFPTKRSGCHRFLGEVWEILPDGSEIPREHDLSQIDPNKD